MKTARVTVQFQSVIEKFSPNDTVFSFAESTDLRDSALSSACSLHTATASIKSSNDSLPQKCLAEITEDVSEPRADTVQRILAHGGSTSSVGIEDTRFGPEKVNGFASADLTRHRSTSATTQSSSRPRASSNTDKPLPLPPGSPEDHTREDMIPGSLLDYGEHNTRPSTDGRFSSSSTRPSTRDLYDAYGYKKKAKMGPRPSTDSVGAPSNLGIRTDEFRPVSTLPAGLRMPSRKAVPPRPASRQTQTSPPIRTSSPIKSSLPAQANFLEKMTSKTIPGAPVTPICTPDRNLHIPTNGLRTTRLPEPGSPKLTPEKQRLMKALKLRKEQIAAQNSVNGLGIRNTSEEPELGKSEIDDSILSAVFDASNSTEGLEPVPNTAKDLAKEGSRPLEDSPISVPETVEEPSTQASSITDEEEAVAQERQESHLTSIPLVLEHHYLSNNLSKNTQSYLTGRHQTAVDDPKGNLLTENGPPEHLSHSDAPMQPESEAAGQNVIEHKVEGKESSKPEKHDYSGVMNGGVPAEAIGGEKQLSPSQALGSQTSRIQSIADKGDPLPDRRITAELDENSEVKQSEPQSGYEKVPSTGEALKNEDFVQSPCLWESEKVQSTLSPNGQARVLQLQSERSHRRSLEHPVQESDESTPQEPSNDVVQPLLVRRSSSAKSIAIPSDNINAHEVPLPPIDEDEEISLSPQRALFRKEANTYHSPHTDGELRTTIRGAEIPLRNSEHQVTGNSTPNGVGERQFRSQGAVNPIRRVSSPDQSDEQFLSDDSFMEELKSATVQEAKPVSVSKSPIKPVFSRSESEQKLNGSVKGSRSVSTPVDRSAKDGEIFPSLRPSSPLSTARSVSAQHAPRPDSQQSNVPVSKKIGVSSSISQRIKALEQLSSRPTSPVSPKLAPNTPTFLGLRATSLRTPSSGSEHKNSIFNKGRPDTAYPSPSPPLETIKSTLPNQSKKAECTHPTKSASTATARGTREKSPNFPSDPSEPRYLELQETLLQLEVPKSPPPTERKTMGPPPLSPLKPPRPRFGRYSSTRSGSSSSNEQKLEPQPTTRRDSFASVRSKSSRAGSEVELPLTLSDSSQSGVTSLDGTQDEKKDSRRSRLLKRMSSISSMSRRSIALALSPSRKEAPIIERQEPVQEALSTSVDVGDVNVQFPDNLVSSAFNFWLTSANTYFSFGRGDTWSLMRTAF